MMEASLFLPSFSFPFYFFLLPVASCFYDNSMICAGQGTLPVPRESIKSTLLNLLQSL